MADLTQMTSTLVWIRAILYLVGRLVRERTTRHFAPALRTLVEALDRAVAATESAIRAVTDARSAVDAADADIDEEIGSFEADLLLSVGKNRKAARYRKVFPKGLVGATRTRSGEQAQLARRVEESIERELPDVPFAQEALPKIRAAREELERREATLRTAQDNLGAARAAERAARMEASSQYRIMHGELVRLFPYNLRKVQGFFRHERSDAGAGDKAETPPAAEPAPEAAPPAAR